MSRFARSSLFAALIAGVTIPATIGRAASPYDGSGDSRIVMVSATEDQPQMADPSSVRLADPRVGSSSAAQPHVPAATKPAAPQYVTQPAVKTVRPALRPVAPVAKQPAHRQPAPNYYSQRNGVQLTAQVSVEPSRHDAMMVRSAPATPASPPSIPSSPELDGHVGEYASCPTCDSCCDSCCGFCAGMEYLFLRPHFADDAAFEQMTTTSTITTVSQNNQLINFVEPYSSDYHFFLGYHNGCGDEFRFGFWHIADDGNRSGTASGDFLAGAGTAFQGPGTTELTAAGETINATSHMNLNMYDIDDVKHLNLPGCGCNCCPDWDVRWSYGLRVADFRHTVDLQTPFETVNNEGAFVGAGPKLGLEVRRQIGHSKVSAFVSSTAALLLGEARNRSTTTTPSPVGLQTAIVSNASDGDIIVPDFNISVGLEWHPWCHTTITGGYMFEEFGNLGTAGATTCTTCSTTSGTIGGGDLSFDGLFIRAEHCF